MARERFYEFIPNRCRPDKRFVVGVQWHPENQIAAQDGIARKLFDAFAAAL